MSLEGKTKDITIALPSLIATQEFEPTAMMIKTLCVYLEVLKQLGKPLSPPEVIMKLGHSRRNWYYWLEKPLFIEWWTKACEEFFAKTGLYDVHSALYRCALLTNCPQDRKVYLDRFDPNYKPATSQDVHFPGMVPPDGIPAAVERSKARAKALTNSQDGQQAPQQAAGQESKAEAIPEAGQGQEAIQGSTGQAETPLPPFEGGEDDNNTPATDFSENGVVDSSTP